MSGKKEIQYVTYGAGGGRKRAILDEGDEGTYGRNSEYIAGGIGSNRIVQDGGPHSRQSLLSHSNI